METPAITTSLSPARPQGRHAAPIQLLLPWGGQQRQEASLLNLERGVKGKVAPQFAGSHPAALWGSQLAQPAFPLALTSARASASRDLWSPRLLCLVEPHVDLIECPSERAFLSG